MPHSPTKTVCSCRLLPCFLPGWKQSGVNPPQFCMNPGFFITFRTLLQQHLFNEFMAKDTSRKIKGAFRAKFLNGERMYSIAPFGYVKQPKIKNKLRMVRTPDEKCLRIEGTHEAIIETEVFESVQKQIASRRRERKNKTM